MPQKHFELTIGYGKWTIDLKDSDGNPITSLRTVDQKWYSNFFSSSFEIGGERISIKKKARDASIEIDEYQIGEIKTEQASGFERKSTIKLGEFFYFLKQKNWKAPFVIFDEQDKCLMTIEGKVYRDKQRNFFGLIYVDDKLFYDISVEESFLNNKDLGKLLVLIGYSIRLFFDN